MNARQPCFDTPANLELRAANPADRRRIASFLAAMDRDGLYDRHFAHGEAPNLALLDRLDRRDQVDSAALAMLDCDERIAACGEYVAERGAAACTAAQV